MDHGGATCRSARSRDIPGVQPPAPRIIDEAEEYTSTVAGVTVEAVRVGRGLGPNVVLGVPGEQLTFTMSKVGFPMHACAHIPGDRIVAAFIHENPAGSRWCGIELKPGSALVYLPGTEHVAVNRPGLRFGFVIADVERLAEFADLSGTSTGSRGPIEVAPSEATQRFGVELNRLARTAVAGGRYQPAGEKVLRSFAGLLTGEDGSHPRGNAAGIDSRVLVHTCLEFAETTDRIPSIAELCNVAHVSERRLREAFTEVFDAPPTVYFRSWALDRAHRRLRTALQGDCCTVTDVALGLGFGHLGRFAGRYREIYGVAPSETLASTSG